MRTHTVLASITLALVVSVAPAARADFMLEKRINEINRSLEDARRYLPKPVNATDWQSYLQQLAYDVAPMDRALAGAKGGLHPSLAEEGEKYEKMMANLKEVEQLNARVQSLLVPGAAMQQIDSLHKRGQPAGDRLDKLDRAIDDAEKTTKADAWAAPHIAAFRRFAAQLRQRDAEVAKEDAEKRARRDAEAKQNDLQALYRRAASFAEKALAAGTPPSAETLAELERMIAELEARQPGAALFLRLDALRLRLLQRWEKPDPEAQQAIAGELHGTLEAKGRSQGKKLELKVSARPDTCYLFVAHWALNAEGSSASDVTWAPPKGKQVQEFTLNRAHQLQGFCAVQPVAVTGKADLEFAGSKNGLRWAVVSFPREKLPEELWPELSVSRGDWCDPVFYEAMWTRPLPGTVAYDKNQPVLVLSRGLRSSEVVQVNNPAGNHGSQTSNPLTGSPTGPLRFDPAELDFGSGCPANEMAWRVPKSPLSLKKTECLAAVTKRYEKAWELIEGQRSAARREGGIAPAVENRATELSNKMEKESAACMKVDDVAEKEIAKVTVKLVDRFLEAPPKDSSGWWERYYQAARLRGY